MYSKNKQASEKEQRNYNFIRIWGRRYNHMKARHEGRSTNSSQASGKGLMSREDFTAWCKQKENMDIFIALYYDWMLTDFALHAAPSIDRIYPDKGYVAENIQWMSFGENCEKNNKHPITHERVRN